MTQSLEGVFRRPGKGANADERKALEAVAEVENLANHLKKYWEDFLSQLPHGWTAGGSVDPSIDRDALARFIVEHTVPRLVTGVHDASGVDPSEVGSGLQSLLDMELRQLASRTSDRPLVVAIEEPEAFLHPSAQRYIGRILSTANNAYRAVVATHSPLVLEESSFDQIVIVRDHIFHQPSASATDRSDVNNSLVSDRGAEALFARSVLLVEGPGDRAFYEELRRRLAHIDESGSVDHCYVLDVGGNTRFAPWMRLLSGYSPPVFNWLAVLDFDSAKQVREAVTDAKLSLTVSRDQALRDLGTHVDELRVATTVGPARKRCDDAAKEFNNFGDVGLPILLAPGDLEWIMTASLSESTLQSVGTRLALDVTSTEDLARKLGTKYVPGCKAVTDSKKHPWIRQEVARLVPPRELDEFALTVLRRWLTGASDKASAQKVLKRFQAGG